MAYNVSFFRHSATKLIAKTEMFKFGHIVFWLSIPLISFNPNAILSSSPLNSSDSSIQGHS